MILSARSIMVPTLVCNTHVAFKIYMIKKKVTIKCVINGSGLMKTTFVGIYYDFQDNSEHFAKPRVRVGPGVL